MDYVDITTAAKLTGWSRRHIRRRCIKGSLSGAKKEKGRWSIPVSAHPKLFSVKLPGESMGPDELLGLSAGKRAEALRKVAIVQECIKFVAGFVRNNRNRCEAVAIFASMKRVSVTSLRRWMRSYQMRGLAGLIDHRGGDTASIFTPEAAEFFKAMFLDERRLSVKVCWLNTCYENKARDHNWLIPGQRAIYRWVQDNIPMGVQVLLREGKAAYEARCAPYVQCDPDTYAPGECWVGDHHQFNFWVRYRNRWVRPWLTAWEDCRSRDIVGWHISASPNQTTILIAMKPAIEKFGPPDKAKIDNGKDYDSEMWTGTTKARRRVLKKGYIDEGWIGGLYAWMGIDVSFSIKYHPQSKSIERLFATVDEQFSKTIPTYCGKDPQRRPENLKDLLKSEKVIKEAYTLETISQAFEKYAQAYNSQPHTGAGMNGKSPDEVLATRTSRRVIDKEVLDMLLCVWSGELTIGKNGVRFGGMLYGQYSPDLISNFGKKVRVSYDPNDVRSVAVYDAKSLKLICIAEQNRLINFSDPVSEEFTRAAIRQQKTIAKSLKAYRDTRQLAGLDLTDLTIKALQDAGSEKSEKQSGDQTLRPVRTPLDGQAEEFRRQITKVKLRKAAGAEGMSEDMQFDLDALRNNNESVKLNLFSEDPQTQNIAFGRVPILQNNAKWGPDPSDDAK